MKRRPRLPRRIGGLAGGDPFAVLEPGGDGRFAVFVGPSAVELAGQRVGLVRMVASGARRARSFPKGDRDALFDLGFLRIAGAQREVQGRHSGRDSDAGELGANRDRQHHADGAALNVSRKTLRELLERSAGTVHRPNQSQEHRCTPL